MTTDSPDDPVTGTGQADDPKALRIPVGHERVVVRKIEVEQVAARVSLRTHAMDFPITETLRTERVEIDRVPVDRIYAEPPQPRVENGITIIPVVEEVLVRQFRVVEEVRIFPVVEEVPHAETVTLRRQEAVVEEAPDDEMPAEDPVPDQPV